MKRLLATAALAIGVLGCADGRVNSPPTSKPPEIPIANDEARNLKITVLGHNDYGWWRRVEYTFEGTRYVYLQHYDGNNQGLVLMKQEPVRQEKLP